MGSKYRDLNPFDRFFGTISALALMAYLLVRGTPSSYSLVYRVLGINSSNIFGFAQPIRSDEYGVGTPKLISAKLAHWNPVNINSVYQERFGPAFPVPRHSASMIFDVFQWPYLVFPFDWAYTLSWVLLFSCGIFGWRVLLGKLNISPQLAWLGVFLLIFNAFQQAWLTVLANNFFTFPLIALALINASKHRLRLPAIYLIGAAVFSISLYVPGLVPICFVAAALGLTQIVAKKLSWKQLFANVFALLLGMISIIGLRFSEFQALNQTVYPGARMGTGGGVSIAHWASQFLPTLMYTGWESIAGMNTCEAAAVGTLLPLAFIFYSILQLDKLKAFNIVGLLKRMKTQYISELILLATFGIFTLWQLKGFPEWLATLSFLGHAGASRTFMASGPVLIILCLRILSRGQMHGRKILVAIFLAAITNGFIGSIFASHRPTVDYVAKFNVRGFQRFISILFNHDDWIALVVLLGVLVPLVVLKYLNILGNKKIVSVFLFAGLLVPNMVIWGSFNPIYSSSKIIAITKTPAALHVAQYFRGSDEVIILPGSLGPIGWLGNIGIKTPQAIQEIPPINYWKNLIGDRYSKYETILNRYAYIEVSDIPEPVVKQGDYIQVPRSWFDGQPNYIIPTFAILGTKPSHNSTDQNMHKIMCNKPDSKTTVDSLSRTSTSDNFEDVTISGWLNDQKIRNYAVSVQQDGNTEISITSLTRNTRFDVLNAINFASGVSGYSLAIKHVKSDSCYTVNFRATS